MALSLLAGACKREAPKPEPEEKPRAPHVLARLTFEEVVYVEAGASTWKLIEHVRSAKNSLLPALEKLDVTLPVRKANEIDLPHVKREPVSVVDPVTGTKRGALRLRYFFSAVALIPEPLAAAGFVELGLLHSVDRARAEPILSKCTAGGERERAPGADLGSFFDPTLPSCKEAIAEEASAIAVAGKRLDHPDKEIVPQEMTRSYMPVTLHFSVRHAEASGGAAAPQPQAAARLPAAAPPPGQLPTPSPEAPAAAPEPLKRVALIGDYDPNPAAPALPSPEPGPAAPAPYAPAAAVPGAPAAPQDESASLAAQLLAYRDESQDLAEDEAELGQKDHAAAVAAGLAPPPLPVSDLPPGEGAPSNAAIPHGAPAYLQPNFAILYVALGVGGLILVGKRRVRR
jgi:hypothetical protein